jgi:hypothetical protein
MPAKAGVFIYLLKDEMFFQNSFLSNVGKAFCVRLWKFTS